MHVTLNTESEQKQNDNEGQMQNLNLYSTNVENWASS
jgi:hypothetical protein